MPKRIAIIISPNWQDYGQKYLPECLASLRQQNLDCLFKLWLLDNASTVASYNYLKSLAPEAEILRFAKNEGFAKPNNQAMRQALAEGYDYLLLVNIDTVLAPNAINQMIEQLEAEPTCGAVQARLMLWSDKTKINSLGNSTHFLGFGYGNNYQEEYNNKILGFKFQVSSFKNIAYPSGAGVLFRAAALKKVGLFDEEFWMYNEDQDLGWRLWLAGYQCLLAPSAVIYHKYSFSKSIQKYYWMERNRLIVIFKNYHRLTLLLILPAWLIMEVGLCLFALQGGWFKEKIKVYQYFIKKDTWLYLQQARRQSQTLRQVSDKKIIKLFSGRILYQEIDSPILRLANFFFNIYWQIIKLLIIW